MSHSPSGVLLLGSLPFATNEEVFKTAIESLPNRLERIPDGETGHRGNFVAFQLPVFPNNVVQTRFGGQPPAQKTTFNYTASDLNSTRYDQFAIESYGIFGKLQTNGTIPSDIRFQVCFPSPLGVVRGFIETEHCTEIEPLYETKLLEVVR